MLALTTSPAFGTALAGEGDAQAEAVYPGDRWDHREPVEVGLRTAELARFRSYVGGRGMVVRRGFEAFSWGDVARKTEVASAGKPIHTHLLLEAIRTGRLHGADDGVAAFEPRLNALNPHLGFKDRDITWRHLANMTSGYGLIETPGAAFAYNDYAMALYFDTLVNRVYGSPWETADADVLMPVLGDPIGWQDAPTLVTGPKRGRVSISLRDHARFGWLYRHRGKWRDVQLLPVSLVELVTRSPVPASLPRTSGADAEMIPGQRTSGGGNDLSDHFGSYSFTWWTNGTQPDGSRLWPALPIDAFAAHGHLGRRMLLVVPSLDLVVAWNESPVNTLTKQRTAFALLMSSVE